MIDICKEEFLKAIKNKDFQNIVKYIINSSNSILDIGCGIGDYLKYTNTNQRVVGVEPHLPYLLKAKEVAPWVEFVNNEAIDFFSSTEEKFDCILLIDILEHLEENDAIKLVEEAKKHCNGIIFSQIPIGVHEQHEDIWNLGGEFWQTHRSIWTPENVYKLRFSFLQIWNDWYDWEHKDKRTSIAFWTKHPLVSVIVPSYNQANWLPKTLDSIISQTYPVWEAIVVDDGSTDNTWEVIQEYSIKDSRIKGIHKENGGISSALNSGIEAAKGKYFCWLSSDDLFYPNKLELQIKAFDKLDESYGIIFGAFDLIDDKEKINVLSLDKPFIDGFEFPQQLKYDMIDGCTVMIPMRIMREMGGFNTQFKHAQDTEFWFRLAAKGYKFYYLEEKLVKRRIHEAQGFTDFQLDCRYDGYAIVQFYLSRYSFRDFYKNVDWSKQDDQNKFMHHFIDMITDKGCHINHDVLNEQFWNWFMNGLKTLDWLIRKTILSKGINILSERKNEDKIIAKYFRRFESALKVIGGKQQNSFTPNNKFEDITKFDRSTEKTFSSALYEFGIKEEKNYNVNLAASAFKYLADYPNPFTEKAFSKFVDWCFTYEEYQKFVKSFRRKGKLTQFDDDTKLLYIWAKLSLKLNDGIDEIIESILDNLKKEKALGWLSGNYERIRVEDIHFWNYQVIPSNIEHFIKVRCKNCNTYLSRKVSFLLAKEETTQTYLCTSCFTGYELNDGLLKDYFKPKFISAKTNPGMLNRSPKVAFIMRYTNIIGGGVKVAYKHIQWLADLGCEITIYSDAPKPEWINLPGKFIRVKDHYEINNINADKVIVFSVYDVPKILTKVDNGKVYHLCQGYEGYHIGRNYDEMRSDKYFYTTLHSFEVGNILVSDHLMKLFKEKFGRNGHYIPNSIDLNTYFPNPKIHKEPNSILFIGNPNDPLKGFKFLIEVLSKLQSSSERFKHINLYIVYGGTKIKGEQKEKTIAEIEIHYLTGLSGNEIAALMNRVSLVVNCSWYEGFSLPILEAMACGTPTITTNNMGIESFCVNMENSLIINYGDTDSFIERIKDILLNRIDVQYLIRNGFNTALNYSTSKVIAKFIVEYSNILSYKFDEKRIDNLIDKFNVDEESIKSKLESKLKYISPTSLNYVSIIIVTYNQIKYTLQCIDSIQKFIKIPYEIIIIDNASFDETSKKLTEYEEIKLICNDKNIGFPAAVNQGLSKALGDYILILNNDTVLTENLLERLLEVAQSDTNIGIVGPISNEVSGLQKDKDAKYNSIEEMHKYAAEVQQKNKGEIIHFPRVAFLCTLIKREVIDKIGGLDERFSPGNYEDDDFCLRAQLAGYKTIIVKDAFIHHYGSKSFKANGEKAYAERLMKNQKIFVEKWGATPDEIWLQNKTIKPHQIFYPINIDLFKQYFDRTKVNIADKELSLAKENIELAIDNYNSSSASIISLVDLFDMAANICLAQSDFDNAKNYFELELQHNNNSAQACFGLGKIFYLQNNLQAAKTMFEWAVKNDPNYQQAMQALEDVNISLGIAKNHNSLVETNSA